MTTTCSNGHPRTELNTYVRPDGFNGCRTCRQEASARHRAAKHGLRSCQCGCGTQVTGTFKRGHHHRRPVLERFSAKIQETATCWLWTGHLDKDGYGRIGVNGTSALAYRIGYELLVGPIPHGLELDHLCNVRACVRPDHLDPVTHAVNVARAFQRQEAAS